ncbi:hypothetical protein T07_15250 [Trichinella nelsoni]|uniref:WAP domain-containing protein n=1 Tax=Trichinella nelsoni TaxID=6336 RepID=A0A0V0RJB1_9BILA|nr:hypothetical protein T07_15250 [Trichinella nelsoni]
MSMLVKVGILSLFAFACILINAVAERDGHCPIFYYDYRSPDAKDTCHSDDECPSKRLCCETIMGKYCLLPEIRLKACSDGSLAPVACIEHCPDNYDCVDNLCCPANLNR